MMFARIRSEEKCKYILASVGDAGLLAAAMDQNKFLLQGNGRDVATNLHNKEYLQSEDCKYEVGL